MRYEDPIDESRQYLRLALEQIGKHGLPTDPLNYCVWYEYASGKNPALKTAIDSHLEDTGTFQNVLSQKIYEEFIAGQSEILNQIVHDGLKKIIGDILSSIKTSNLQYTESGSHLGAINDRLLTDLTQAEVGLIVKKITHEIKNLESTATSFKARLDQATDEINQLKNKLEQYREESLKDPLTGIENRRGFDTYIQNAMEKANNNGTPLCLVLADIDYFKKINDTHGHMVGDNVLRMVAATLKDSVKGRDLVARIGGEEFATILPETPFRGAMKLADDMRIRFESLDLKKKSTGECLGKITLSFGVTEYKKKESAWEFVNRADNALYQAKNSGRNMVSGI